MDMRELFPGVAGVPPAVDVTDIATHSGEVVPGGLFLACAGARAHGLSFLGDALSRGARAVAWEPEGAPSAPLLPAGVAGIAIPGLGRRLGTVANRYFAAPSAALSVSGITGTNGKTTVAWLVVQALGQLGRRAAYIGTLGHGLAGALQAGELTTPDCITLHRRLRQFADAGAGHAVMEVSSHALDQHRVDGIGFRVAAFTNLSRDHLDYHGDMARYGDAKKRLFSTGGARTAVLNIGDDFGRVLAADLPAATRALTVAAVPAGAELEARSLGADAIGQRIEFRHGGGLARLSTPLPGQFNVENLVVAAGILLAEGFGLQRAAAALEGCGAPPGRMQIVTSAAGPRVVVDFAHTPDALARALTALRPQAQARLWCVFGCGGERDPGKRAPMGEVARRLADRVIVTDDNPRGEDPDSIVAGILEGAGRDPAVTVIRDRREAIRHAIRSAGRDDVVLIAGKGHETGQVVAGETRPFSDRDVAAAALAELP